MVFDFQDGGRVFGFARLEGKSVFSFGGAVEIAEGVDEDAVVRSSAVVPTSDQVGDKNFFPACFGKRDFGFGGQGLVDGGLVVPSEVGFCPVASDGADVNFGGVAVVKFVEIEFEGGLVDGNVSREIEIGKLEEAKAGSVFVTDGDRADATRVLVWISMVSVSIGSNNDGFCFS